MQIDHPTARCLPGLRQLWQEAFGDSDAFLDSFFATAYAPERCMCIMDGQTVAAAAYWFDCAVSQEPCTYIYAVATAKRYRGQGLCHRLMDAIHRHLARQNCCGSIVVPGDGSLREFYRHMGYGDFGGLQTLSCAAGRESVPLEPISAQEYSRLRPGYLAQDSVLQEGENLAFLSTFARFYRGSDFLLCGAVEQQRLLGLEFLGAPQLAPAIVKALDAQWGDFRLPGSTPFAMYRPITPRPAPAYFAFAFD